MKVKILKDHAAGKTGEIIDVNFPGGDEQEYVENGYIEILKEDGNGLTTQTEGAVAAKEQQAAADEVTGEDNMRNEIKKLVGCDEIKKDMELTRLSKTYKIGKGVLSKQLKSFIEEEENNKKKLSRHATNLLHESIDSERGPEDDVYNFLIIHTNDEGQVISTKVNVDKVAMFIEDKFNIRTIYGIKEETIEVYCEGMWTIKGRGIIKSEIERILKNHSTNNVVSEILEKIKRRTEIQREDADIIPEFKRCVEDGVLDLDNPEDIKFLPHSKDYNFRSKFPMKYNPKAKCTFTQSFMSDAFYQDDVKLIQEWFGFHLIRRYSFKKALIINGPKDTSKTVILNLLTRFLGGNVSGLSIQEISVGKPFDLKILKDKDANICDDLSSRDMKAVGGFKKAVGDGYIDAEHKFGDKIRFRNTAKDTNACNTIPLPGEDIDDEAYYGRILLVNMDNVIPLDKQDDKLIDKLTTPEELSGLLNWAIEGYRRLKKQNKFTNDKTPAEVKFLMIQNGDSLAKFSSEVLIHEDGEKISKDDMYTVYCKWCSEHKPQLSPDTKEKIGRKLSSVASFVQAGKSGSNRYWLNCKLRDTWDTFFKTYSGENKDIKDITIDKDVVKNNSNTNIYKFAKSVPSVPKIGIPDTKDTFSEKGKSESENIEKSGNYDDISVEEDYEAAGFSSKEEYEEMMNGR